MFLPQPYLCEASYILLEYARTAMFLWMFIEGLYLHNVVTVTVFQGRFPHVFYCVLGWGVPVLMAVSKFSFLTWFVHDHYEHSKDFFPTDDLKIFLSGDMGRIHSYFIFNPKMLVWVQFNALLLDS